MSTPRLPLFRPGLQRLLGLLLLSGLTAALPAQSIMVQEPASTATPRVIPPSSGAAGPGQSTGVEFGRLRLRPQAYVRYMHADGLPLGTGAPVDSDILTFSAGLGVELGDHWLLNYAPTWINYSAAQFRDSVNHSFSLSGATLANDWDLRLNDNFSSSNDVLAETAQQTKQRSWQSSISAAHPVGQHSKYEGTFAFNRTASDFGNPALDLTTETWSTDQWFNSQFTPKLSAGLGVSLGWLELQRSADMRYDQYLGKIEWRPTEKITLTTQGGTEKRHSDGNNINSPVFQTTLDYRPLDFTHLSVGWSRNTAHSPVTNQLTKNKGWNVSANQRLLGKLQLSLTYAEADSDYSNFGTGPTTLTLRSDKVRSFNGTLTVLLLQRWTLSAIYQTSRNDSSLPLLDFSTKQYGLELRVRF